MKRMSKQVKSKILDPPEELAVQPYDVQTEFPIDYDQEDLNNDSVILEVLAQTILLQNKMRARLSNPKNLIQDAMQQQPYNQNCGLDELYNDWKETAQQAFEMFGRVEAKLQEMVWFVAPRSDFPETEVCKALQIISLLHQHNQQLLVDMDYLKKRMDDSMELIGPSAKQITEDLEWGLSTTNELIIETREGLLVDPLANAVHTEAIGHLLRIQTELLKLREEMDAARWTQLPAIYSRVLSLSSSTDLRALNAERSRDIASTFMRSTSAGHVDALQEAAENIIACCYHAGEILKWIVGNCAIIGLEMESN